MLRTRLLRALAAVAVLAAVPAAGQQDKRPLTPLDLYHLRFASQVALSPDGRSVAYVVSFADSATNKYRRELWMARTDGSGARRLTWLNVSASAPAFSPDGRQLAFVSAREGKPSQVWILPLAEGGEAWPLTSLETGAFSPVWSPRGDRIAFATDHSAAELDSALAKADTGKVDAAAIRNIDDNRAAALAAIRTRLRNDAKDGDPRVVTRLNYYGETAVRGEERWDQVYVVDVREGAKPTRLTSGVWDTGEPDWSPDGRSLVVSSGQPQGEYHPDWEREGELVVLSAAGGGTPRRISERGYAVFSPSYSPDGQWIAYMRQHVDTKYFTAVNADLMLMRADGTGRVNVDGMDRPVDNYTWSDDGWLYFTVENEGAVELHRKRPGQAGAAQKVVSGPRGVLGFDVAGGTVAWTQMSPQRPSDVHAARADGTGERRVTTLNDSLLARVYVADYEEIWYPSFDGKRVQGWFLRPKGYRPGMRPPLAVQMHGGPHVMWGPGEASMWLEYQALAGAGYTVFFANPRGSDGYGEGWMREIHQNWGTPPARDVLTGADSILARGLADPDKQVITGGSYAGYLTAWIIAREAPTRFKAAVAQRGVFDLTIWASSSNSWRLFQGEFEGMPWQQATLAREQSPLTHVANVRTPLLILHGDLDYRANIASADAFYRALTEMRRPVEFVRYPREGHEVTRSGEPEHRVDHMFRIIEFFERHVTH